MDQLAEFGPPSAGDEQSVNHNRVPGAPNGDNHETAVIYTNVVQQYTKIGRLMVALDRARQTCERQGQPSFELLAGFYRLAARQLDRSDANAHPAMAAHCAVLAYLYGRRADSIAGASGQQTLQPGQASELAVLAPAG